MIPNYQPLITPEDADEVARIVAAGQVSSQANVVVEFENKFADVIGDTQTLSGIATSSCTAALHIVLEVIKRVGDGVGTKVICPTLTFISPVNMVLAAGLEPIFCDIDPVTFCFDEEQLNEILCETDDLLAAIVVHNFGKYCLSSRIMKSLRAHGLFVVEDWAEALGVSKLVSDLNILGDFACYSFFANKIITTGEGGLILTNNVEFANHCKLLRDHGMERVAGCYEFKIPGFNYRMTAMQAALGLSQLKRLDTLISIKQAQVKKLNYLFDRYGVKFLCRHVIDVNSDINWMNVIKIERDRDVIDEIFSHMRSMTIDVRRLSPPCSMVPYLENYSMRETMAANDLYFGHLIFPSGPTLEDKHLDFMIKHLSSCLRE